MTRLAMLVTHAYWPGRPDRAESDYTLGQFLLLEPRLAALGIRAEPVFWEDDGNDWRAFDAACPLMAWNYPAAEAVFRRRLAQIDAAGARLVNPLPVLLSNMDKGYLADLARAGAPVPPTLEIDRPDAPSLERAFAALDADEIVVKPRIGAGAWRQARLRRGAPLPPPEALPPAGALVQPFLPAVAEDGEYSLLWFGGRFSHALRKVPKPGDYRTQGQHGAVELAVEAPAAALAAAEAVLACATSEPLAYARVDLVRGADGQFLLMELELIEPWLYLKQDRHDGAAGAAAFAAAMAERLSRG